MKPTDSNAAKASQSSVAKPPPSEGVAPEPTIIAEQRKQARPLIEGQAHDQSCCPAPFIPGG